MATLFVLMKDGVPFQLPCADPETLSVLSEFDNGVDTQLAFASTTRQHIEVMRQILPRLLDADGDMGLTIGTFKCEV